MTAYSIFNKVFSSYSKNIALYTSEGKALTFEQLRARCSQLASYLEKQKIGNNELVAILMDRNSDYLIATATCLLYGYGFICLDTQYPQDRIDMILADSKAAFVIDKEVFEKLASEEFLTKSKRKTPDENTPAYVVYTSGSTGRPKGILHDQRSLAESVNVKAEAFELTSSDTWGVAAPFTFVALTVEVFATWVRGAGVKIIPRNIVKDPELLSSYIEENKITATFIPPRALKLFKKRGTSLHFVITGGERVDNIYPQGFRLVGGYGQSETCGPCVWIDIKKPYDVTPLGKPGKQNGMYILDENGKECTEGEICLTGYFMTSYINNPESTSKTVEKNPFKDKDGCDFLIHTGDLGRVLDNGDIVYVNRKDWMIKINGQRVEPGEIECVLKKVDSITDAAVKSFENRYGQTYICAYYTSSDDIESDKLRNIMTEKLPSYMVPSFFVHLESLPLNINRKLDRSALKEPDTSSFLKEYVMPRTEEESVICQAFSKVLGLDKVGIDDDFFRLGGDSIKAVMVANECSRLGLSVRQIFTGVTPQKIACLLRENSNKQYLEINDTEVMSLSDSQMGIYLDCPADKPDCRYNIPFAFSFPKSETDSERLRDAVYETWKNHQIFSLDLVVKNGSLVMQKNGSDYPKVQIIKATEEEYENIKKSFVKPFVLGKECLYRAAIVETDNNVNLLFDIHHIIFDGTSLEVFEKDLCDAYFKRKLSREIITPFMISAFEKNSSNEEEKKRSTEYFKEVLSLCETDSNINRDIFVPEMENKKGTLVYCLDLDSRSAEYFTNNAGITENTLFSSAFALALAKFTCQNQSLFLAVENGRHISDFSSTIGMLVRSFPVFVPIDEEKTTLDYLKEVQTRFFDAMSHDAASIAEIASECDFKTDVKFVYQSEILSAFDFLSSKILAESLPVDQAMSNLDIMVLKQNGCYKISISYRKSMYSEALIESFAETFDMIVKGLVKCTNLKDINFVSEKQVLLLDAFNQTDCEYNEDQSTLDMFENIVKKYPNNNAVCFEGKKLTYLELNRLSDKIALYIKKQNIEKDSFIAILTSRTILMPAMVWGVVKSSCAYQPLDPSYPADRLSFMLQDSGAKLLIAERSLADLVSSYKGPILFTDEIEGLPEPEKHETDKLKELKAEIKPQSRLVLLYTSGTTGLPKGVVITHKNVVSLVFNHAKTENYTPSSRCALYASFGFDAFVMDMFTTQCSGAELYIVPENIRLDLRGLEKFYTQNKITNGFITTQLGCMFAQTTKSEDLKYLMVGGEKLIPFTPKDKFAVLNGYGPSECVAYITQYKVNSCSPIQPIGKPNYNIKLYIVDKYLRRLPVGCSGELLIAGAQVSDSYLNRPDKTSQAFVENPFTKLEKYSRVYRTGDITRIMPDGNLEFIGRRDGQVKIRGFRIELSEVEQVIRDFEGITNATVQAYDDPNGGKYLAAFITSDSQIDIEKLNNFIESTKPAYMVPSVTMQIDKIPLNQNGKVDKKMLPKPKKKAEIIVEPQNKMQKEILDYVCSLLGTQNIGITTDIFKSGLTSLGSIRLNAHLSDAYNVDISTKDLKENSTVEKLEIFISTHKDNAKTEEKTVVYTDFPITKTQEGIFVECQTKPESTVYNIPYLLKISPDIDERRLKLCICEAVEAHCYINTTLFYDNLGCVRQKIASFGAFTLDCIETIETSDINTVLPSLVKPFNLLGERLFRIKFIKAGGETYLFMDFHHIIFDGSSMLIFINDIEQSYMGQSINSEKYTGYDVAVNEQKLLNSHYFLDAEKYYENLLAEAETDCLVPSDMHVKANKGSGSFVAKGRAGLCDNVSEYCRKHNVSENSVLCTCFGYVLSVYNGMENSVFTTVYNGRNNSRMSRTVSMLVKTLPVVFKRENDNVDTAISNMSKELVDSMANDIYSFAEISRKFSVKADVMFIYQGKGFEQNMFCSKECSVIGLKLSDKKAPISIEVTEKDNCYEYNIEYDNTMYSSDFIYCLYKALDVCLSQITEVSSFDEISLVDEDIATELNEINNTDVPFDLSETVVDMLRENAAKYPLLDAVVFKDYRISYKDFNILTDSLASRLLEMGAGPNEYVAILIGRNKYMPITAWGVAKTGGAYLPIDSTYPKERISLMLSDSNAKILIADRDKKELFDGYKGKVIYTDEIDSLPEKSVYIKINSEDPFILIYSSGSTGIPKGSMLPFRSMTALTLSYKKSVNLEVGDRNAFYASFGFDASLMDIFSSLACGSSLYIVPEEIRLDIPALEDFYVSNKITQAFMTTQVARLFMQNTKCTTIKSFLFGGEKMILFEPPKGIHVYNGYGPSETNCFVTLNEVLDTNPVQPIGRQVINTKLYVVDKKGKILPPYACGELCIAGPQVALGYLNRSEKNAQSFVKNVFSTDKNYSVMYKTGDIVRIFRTGEYDFIGRRDGQVKIRGFRIELGEVEHVISLFPGISQVVCTACDKPSGGKFIACYFVSDRNVSNEELADFIKKDKPSYMVPEFIIRLDKMPLNANGKIDKKKLPAPKITFTKQGLEPADETETKLCEIFASVLGCEKVYADDDFFALGGTSLTALQLVVKCVNSGFSVVYKNLFEHPTPQQLGRLIKGELDTKDVFAPSGEEEKKYDYSALEYNVVENLIYIKNEGVGDVLLTGATGFLGVHVLKVLLESTKAKIICLVRGKDGLDPESRLKMLTAYYFEEDYSALYGSRIFVIDGELTDSNLSDKLGSYRFDTILNCAANVHHFGTEEALMHDNYQGINTLINIALSRNARLVQTSTISVSGESVNNSIAPEFRFRENNLNIGQSLENLYVRTKYLAEQEIINAIPRGLKGKIIRFGNLMARDADGEFQINASNNGFLNLVKGLKIIGCFPVDALDSYLEFSPIDAAARALVLLAGTPDKFTVFHANNAFGVHMANILNIMNKIGFNIDYVEPEVFAERFNEVCSNEKLASSLSGLLSYLNNAKGGISGLVKDSSDDDKKVLPEVRMKISNDNSYTVKALYRLGFTWPLTDDEYLYSLIDNLKMLNFFK